MEFDIFSLRGGLICAAYLFAGVIDSISGGGGLITLGVTALLFIKIVFF